MSKDSCIFCKIARRELRLHLLGGRKFAWPPG